VSFRNCMLRVPGSINSKNEQTIRIIQRWNGYRPQINYLLRDFRRYLIDQRVQQSKEQHECSNRSQHHNNGYNSTICWIERLINIPIGDYRKLAVWQILGPYLKNKLGLSYDESYSIISKWLDKCNAVKKLDFNPHHKIKGALNSSNNFLPISKEKLRNENYGVYHLLQENGVFV
jgi:hypothetical protein